MPFARGCFRSGLSVHDHHSFVRARFDPLCSRFFRQLPFVTHRLACIARSSFLERAGRRRVDPVTRPATECGLLPTRWTNPEAPSTVKDPGCSKKFTGSPTKGLHAG